jgi:hypothetical protein
MPVTLKPVALHAIVANAPRIISVSGTAAPNVPRTFNGTGAPSSSTLLAGNGKYNGISSGFIVDAVIYAAGSGYSVGDSLKLDTGTPVSGVGIQLTVDAVDGSGAIVDFHVSAVGNYSVFPDATSGSAYVTSGSGTGAEFMATVPAPDYYIDITTLTEPVLYVCTTLGSNSTSVWAKVSGGGGGLIAMYDTSGGTAYAGGSIVIVASQFTLSGVVVQPGTYGLLSTESTPASPTGNQIPQIPIPATGTIYWIPIAAGLVIASTCATGTTETIYANATGQF